ncbi:MAG: homocitrate synthase/isopropylmalate synthase family protein [Thermoplasmata archaeon]
MASPRLVESYHEATAAQRQFADPIVFWDETLRDGEQTPGVHFSPEEKLSIAEDLSEIGIAVIDAGIPVVSEEEATAVHRLAHAGLKAKILASARTVPGDVDAVIRSGVSHIAVFVAASEVHLRYKLKMSRAEVLAASVQAVRRAKQAGLHVAFVTEDTARAPFDFIEQLYGAVRDEGADRLVVSDTVGIMTPLTFRWFLGEFKRRVKPRDWSVHCHNDFGLATANTLTALEMGVTAPHVTVNGLGERAGNASLEEVAVALEALYGVRTGLTIPRLYGLSRKVEELSGVPLSPNKALVGYNSFSHEAGIHTHGILAHTLTYEPVQPESLGRVRRMILGKHTGRAAVLEKLKERAQILSEAQVGDLLGRIKQAGERRSKTALNRFLAEYRELYEQPGISDAEFWEMVAAITARSTNP